MSIQGGLGGGELCWCGMPAAVTHVHIDHPPSVSVDTSEDAGERFTAENTAWQLLVCGKCRRPVDFDADYSPKDRACPYKDCDGEWEIVRVVDRSLLDNAIRERDEARKQLALEEEQHKAENDRLREMLLAAAWPHHQMSEDHPALEDDEWLRQPLKWLHALMDEKRAAESQRDNAIRERDEWKAKREELAEVVEEQRVHLQRVTEELERVKELADERASARGYGYYSYRIPELIDLANEARLERDQLASRLEGVIEELEEKATGVHGMGDATDDPRAASSLYAAEDAYREAAVLLRSSQSPGRDNG